MHKATNPLNIGAQADCAFGWKGTIPEEFVSNKAFTTDIAFRDACEAAGVEPTSRQASKYRRKTGAAYAKKGS